jgi:hypothetical protein
MAHSKVYALAALFLVGGCGSAPKAPPASAAAMKTKTSVDRSRCDERGKRVVTADVNRDGRPDVWKLFNGGEMTCKQVDFNHDGKVDYVAHFDPGGVPVLEEFDLDFDAKFDEVIFYEGGQVVRKEFDTNHDAAPDIWKYFKDGTLVRMERDTKCSGTVDYWEEYQGGKLARIKWADPNAKGGIRVDDSPEEADEAEKAVETKESGSSEAEKDLERAAAAKAAAIKAEAEKAAAAEKAEAEKAAAEKAAAKKAARKKQRGKRR